MRRAKSGTKTLGLLTFIWLALTGCGSTGTGGAGGGAGGGSSSGGAGGSSQTGGSGGGSHANDDFAFSLDGELNCFGTPGDVAVGQNCTGRLSLAIKKGIAESVTVTSEAPRGVEVFFGYGGTAVKQTSIDLNPAFGSADTLFEIRIRGVAAGGLAKVMLKATSTSHGILEIPVDLTVHSRAGFKLVDVSASGEVNCGVDSSGDAWCWGNNYFGAIGDGSTTTALAPAKVGGNHHFISVYATRTAACGLDSDRKLWCWGTEFPVGAFGAGLSVARPSLTPIAAAGGRAFDKVTFGGTTGCGLTVTGEAWCWGGSGSANVLVGNGQFGGSPTPVQVAGGMTFKDISGGEGHMCGVATSGVVYCWGYNNAGAIGDGTTMERRAPTAISSSMTFESVSAGDGFTCALTTAGTAYCWGLNELGQLGAGLQTIQSNTPVVVSGGITFKSIATSRGGNGVCGIDSANAVHCWGGSDVLEAGVSSQSAVPKAIPGDLTFSKVSVGDPVSCGIATNGLEAVYCWSSFGDGYLGTGNQLRYIGPVPVARPDGS